MNIYFCKEKKDCCGCRACENSCPVNCIEMIEDLEGFLYPEVNHEKCINCHKCESVCPVFQNRIGNEHDKISNDTFPIAVGGYHINEHVRKESSSGGAFTLFAEDILRKEGIVFGCILNEDNEAVHVGIESVEQLDAMRKSKYVQSNTGNTYEEIKRILDNDYKRQILFTGTACQVAGLKTFLGKEYDNLYTLDFICHGVPSPGVFRTYLQELERVGKSKVTSFLFRNKDHGWKQSGLQLGTRIQYENNEVIRKYPAFKDSYMNGFLSDIYLRPSCYDCQFKGVGNYKSDFTIADFWGIDHVAKQLNDGKGTSLILINNQHGYMLWDGIKDWFTYEYIELEKAIKSNSIYNTSAHKHLLRGKFFRNSQKMDLHQYKRNI